MSLTTVSNTINDPIHGIMGFSKQEKDLIKPIIDSAAFQRLRHIKQLGMADLVYPGATHTRFSHCIGACYLSKLMCDQVGIEKRDKELVMIATLLHDVGHGPFSHAFEKLFQKESSGKSSTKTGRSFS